MSEEVVKRLVERDDVERLLAISDIIQRRCGNGTVLHYAVKLGKIQVVRGLIGRGASVDTQDGDGRTALAWAVMKGDKEMVEMLCFLDANPAVKGRDGKAPLTLAGTEHILTVMKDAHATYRKDALFFKDLRMWMAQKELEMIAPALRRLGVRGLKEMKDLDLAEVNTIAQLRIDEYMRLSRAVSDLRSGDDCLGSRL